MKKRIVMKKIAACTLSIAMMMGGAVGCGKKPVEETSTEIQEVNYVGNTTSDMLTLYADGSVLEVACENYSEVNFLYKDLESYIESEISTYNKKEGVSKISLLQYQDANGLVKTAIKYTDFDTYTGFNNMEMSMSAYDSDKADQVAKKEAEKRLEIASITDADLNKKNEISEEELAEAGYSLSQIQEAEEGSVAAELSEGLSVEMTVETFTDVDTKTTVNSSDISTNGNMMLFVNEKMDIKVDSGKILYTNKHAVVENGIATTDGEGTAIIVFYLAY